MHVLDLNEARRNLESTLTESQIKEYFSILRQWFLFSNPMEKEEFDRQVRRFLNTEDQLRCHNNFLLSILKKCSLSGKSKTHKTSNDKRAFENADYSDYVQPSSPTSLLPSGYECRSAASELFIPDSGFIASRITITAWRHGLDGGAEDEVTEVMVYACQAFIKNIITAMITRKKGYKIRDRRFQYGFNQAIPDPFIRNSNNVIDETQESNIEVEDDTFTSKCKSSLEIMEQHVAFASSCARKNVGSSSLTVDLLYDTLRENPKLLGLQSMYAVNLFKLGLEIDNKKG